MITFDLTEFSNVIREIVRQEIKQAMAEKTERFFTVKEAAEMLRVSVSTIHKWKEQVSWVSSKRVVLPSFLRPRFKRCS
jgi:uncharacterized protein YjcR